MNNFLVLLCMYSCFTFANSYHLAIEPAGTHPAEVGFMKIWTTIDFLKAINVTAQEKLAFLSNITNDLFFVYNSISHEQNIADHAKLAWHEWCSLIAQSFDELYDSVCADEVGFFRVVINRLKNILIAPGDIKG